MQNSHPTDAKRQLVCDCRAKRKTYLGLTDGSVYMTGSVGRGTALRGALDLDVCLFVCSFVRLFVCLSARPIFDFHDELIPKHLTWLVYCMASLYIIEFISP